MRKLGAGVEELGSKMWPSESRPQRLQITPTVLRKSAVAVEEREMHCEEARLNKERAEEGFELGLQGYGEVKREGRRQNGLSKVPRWERTGSLRPGQGAGMRQGGVRLEGASETVVPHGGLGCQAGAGERAARRQRAEVTRGGKGGGQGGKGSRPTE